MSKCHCDKGHSKDKESKSLILECPICLDTDNRDTEPCTGCGNEVHVDCLVRWARRCDTVVTCPLCRAENSFQVLNKPEGIKLSQQLDKPFLHLFPQHKPTKDVDKSPPQMDSSRPPPPLPSSSSQTLRENRQNVNHTTYYQPANFGIVTPRQSHPRHTQQLLPLNPDVYTPRTPKMMTQIQGNSHGPHNPSSIIHPQFRPPYYYPQQYPSPFSS